MTLDPDVVEETLLHNHLFCVQVLGIVDVDSIVGRATRALAHSTKMRLVDGIPSYSQWQLYYACHQAIERAHQRREQPHEHTPDPT